MDTKSFEIEASAARLAKLTEDIGKFATQQSTQLLAFEAKAVEQSASLVRLTRQTEEALVGIDAKLVSAAEECKNTAVADIGDLRNQLYTWAVGAKAEINDIEGVIKADKGFEGKGAFSGKGFDGGSKCAGASIDRKEIAVWKLPEDVSKIHFRHWMNAVDPQLEAVHGWRHADIILNWIKRSEDPIDAEVLERCLVEAGEEIDKLEDDFLPVLSRWTTSSIRTKARGTRRTRACIRGFPWDMFGGVPSAWSELVMEYICVELLNVELKKMLMTPSAPSAST